jgi:2',3'-cyclic-nucleotide 2'-phosphodiesterase (5'-nucleotidase family)
MSSRVTGLATALLGVGAGAPHPETQTMVDVEIGMAISPLDSRRNIVRTQESTMGDLIADAMRAGSGADVAITNGGGIRGDRVYAVGTVLTRRDILTELPFGDVTVLIEVTGQIILDALENGVSQVEHGASRFPQVSGLKAVVDLNRPAGSRVISVTVGDKPLDLTQTYKLATNDFMLGGGDGYVALAAGKVLIGAKGGHLVANDVIQYITRVRAIDERVEGRIVTM